MKIALLILSMVVFWSCAVASYIVWGYGWKASADIDQYLHKTAESAAYGHHSDHVTLEVTSTIEKDQAVAVLYDKYGKDFWACYVRTPDFRFGWMVCTDLTAY